MSEKPKLCWQCRFDEIEPSQEYMCGGKALGLCGYDPKFAPERKTEKRRLFDALTQCVERCCKECRAAGHNNGCSQCEAADWKRLIRQVGSDAE